MESPTLELINRSFEENLDISCKTKESVRRFIDHKRKRNRSHGRLVKLASNMNTILTKFAEPGFDLEAADQKDILGIVKKIDESNYSTSTKSDFKSMLKQIYRFFELEERNQKPSPQGELAYTPGKRAYPPKVDFFSTYHPLRRTPDTSKALSEKDLAALTRACRTLQEKCIINALYESGFRSAEFLELRICCVKEDNRGITLTTPGAGTGTDTGRRTVRLAASCDLLSDWMNAHPSGKSPNSRLWVRENALGEVSPLGYNSLRLTLKRVATRAGIDPARAYPGNFRKSRARELSATLTDSEMSSYFGWNTASVMPAAYPNDPRPGKEDSKDGGLDGSLDEKILSLTQKSKPCKKTPEDSVQLLSEALRRNPRIITLLEETLRTIKEDKMRA